MEANVIWGDDKIKGYINFSQKNIQYPVKVELKLELKKVKDGFHGFHVHEKKIESFDDNIEDCCEKLGGHFNVGESWSLQNRNGTKHGVNGHNGDLCNNIYFKNGISEKYFISDKISLYEEDEKCILNRSIIIHEDTDDCSLIDYKDDEKNMKKYITGNAGKRITCGNIEKVN